MSILKISALVVAIVLALFLGFYQTTVFAKSTNVEEKTLENEINRLSIKYKVSSSTVSRIVACESKMYSEAINENYAYKTVKLKNGATTSVKYVWSRDFGPLQINDFWHEDEMTKQGLDIHDEWDSLEYGFSLMKKQGFKPWLASKKCWLK